jgi:glycogen(starch) synthase
MKVLMTTDALGGVFTYCVQLASSLAPLGVEVLLASMGRPLSPEQRAQVRAAGAQVVESDFRLEWMDEPWADVERAGEWLLELERQARPHLVHVNGYAHAALRWRSPALAVAHSSVCSWWRAVRGESAPARYTRYRDAVARGLSAARATVAPTAAMLSCLTEEYGRIARAHVIHNGIELPPRVSAVKEPFVLAAGRVWDPAKNIAQLELAAGELEWPVFVAGDGVGPDGREAPALAGLRALGFLPRAELGRWMQRAAIFALPARYEPFGLSILEAAAAGCALVLGDIPSLRELWGDAAVFVDPSDRVALSIALTGLIADGPGRARLGELARQRAERYGAAAMGGRYLDLYRSLLAPSEASAEAHDRPEMSP